MDTPYTPLHPPTHSRLFLSEWEFLPGYPGIRAGVPEEFPRNTTTNTTARTCASPGQPPPCGYPGTRVPCTSKPATLGPFCDWVLITRCCIVRHVTSDAFWTTREQDLAPRRGASRQNCTQLLPSSLTPLAIFYEILVPDKNETLRVPTTAAQEGTPSTNNTSRIRNQYPV
eukprot:711916-Rhodomonas_salina.3